MASRWRVVRRTDSRLFAPFPDRVFFDNLFETRWRWLAEIVCEWSSLEDGLHYSLVGTTRTYTTIKRVERVVAVLA